MTDPGVLWIVVQAGILLPVIAPGYLLLRAVQAARKGAWRGAEARARGAFWISLLLAAVGGTLLYRGALPLPWLAPDFATVQPLAAIGGAYVAGVCACSFLLERSAARRRAEEEARVAERWERLVERLDEEHPAAGEAPGSGRTPG